MVEANRIVVIGHDAELPHGTVFKFITPDNKEVSPYLVSTGPFSAAGSNQKNLLRAFELEENGGHLFATKINTVILPGVRVKTYPNLFEY